MRILVLACVVASVACSSRVVHERPAPLAAPEAININTASVDALADLPRVGRKTAESIVQFREANGPFRRPEQVMLIRGMSETRFLALRDLIRTE